MVSVVGLVVFSAQLAGYGTVPAGWARDLIRGPDTTDNTETTDSTDETDGANGIDRAGVGQARVWLRRLYATPDASSPVAMESSQRLFDAGLRRILIAREGTCRTPWCDAPIRHLDHVTDHTAGGPTSVNNGQGLCERWHYTKQLAGWHADVLGPPGSSGPHRVR